MPSKTLNVRMRQCISADPEPYLPGQSYDVDAITGVRWVRRGIAEAADAEAYKVASAAYDKAEAARVKSRTERARKARNG